MSTDGRMDERTRQNQYTPFNSVEGGVEGIKTTHITIPGPVLLTWIDFTPSMDK